MQGGGGGNNGSGFTKCVATRDFVGDPNLNQLQFRYNDSVEVDFGRPPQNGWRLGRLPASGKQGWCPEWAVQPAMNNAPPPPPPMAAPPPPGPQGGMMGGGMGGTSPLPPQQQQQQQRPPVKPMELTPQQRMMHQNGYAVNSNYNPNPGGRPPPPAQNQVSTPSYGYGTPVFPDQQQYVPPQSQAGVGDGSFDQRNANIMGGGVPLAQTADGGATPTHGAGTNSNPNNNNQHSNPFSDVPDATAKPDNQFMAGFKNMLHIGGKKDQSPKNEYVNPYTQTETQADSDWADGPQILTHSGKIATMDADGETTHYKNQQGYDNTKAREEFNANVKTTMKNTSDTLHTTAVNVGTHIGNIKLPTGSNKSKNSEQQSQQGSSGPVIEVNTGGNEEQQHQPTVGSAMHKFGKNMRKVGRSLSPKANRNSAPQKTAYLDADGNKKYVTETKKKKSTGSIDIY